MSDEEWLNSNLQSIHTRIVNGLQMPGFPDESWQRQFVGSSGSQALQEAFTFYRLIKHRATQLGRPLRPLSRVLDFGVGWGRIIRFFVKDLHPNNLFGCDVDPAIIQQCLGYMNIGNYFTVSPVPPTIIGDNTFDIIYAYSVLSHLAEHVAAAWIQEFRRILKPGGLLFATTQRRSFLDFCASLHGKEHEFRWYQTLSRAFEDMDKAYRDYDDGRFVFATTGGGSSRPATFYGEAVVSHAYIQAYWTRYLRLLEFFDDPNTLPQALFIMQKPTNSWLRNRLIYRRPEKGS